MADFIPAPFGLYEFDDSDWAGPDDVASRRWFSHWDGPVGAPAEEVSLGWLGGAATAVVCTSGASYEDPDARFRAVHLALGGSELPVQNRPAPGTATAQEMKRIRDDAALWSEIPGMVPDGTAATVVALDGFTAGYTRLASSVIFLAAVGVTPDQFRVRPVRDWQAYDVDARASFPLSALNR